MFDRRRPVGTSAAGSGLWITDGWDLHGNTLIGALGNPGSGWSFVEIADIFGNHQSSILLYNSSTNAYATWSLNDGSARSVANLGSPGSGWTEKRFV